MQSIKNSLIKNDYMHKNGFFVTATDTNIGKTYCSALLVRALNANYFKPIQAGDQETGGDTALVKKILAPYPSLHHIEYFNPIYNLKHPLSPHEAAAKENIIINLDALTLPPLSQNQPLIVEGAGGVMVPINPHHLMIDVIEKFALPAIVVVRSELGTLNHSILTINALKACNIPIAAIIMSGKPMMNNYHSLKHFTGIDAIFINQW